MDTDYYSTIYTWFEKCGIISNIRTHLRQNLVNALRGKDLGLYKSTEAKSAKQYVYDMLIAEYLFNHNYSFTLSIFASEVPLLMNFCNSTSQYLDENNRGSNNVHKLQSDYIEHTLETLGINPNTPEGRHIISTYMNNEVPLLLSILNSITSLIVSTQSSSKENFPCDKQTQANIALEANFVEAAKMRAMKRKIIQQKQLYDNDLKMKESQLKQQASIVKHQLSSLHTKMEEAQNLMQNLTLKEKQLNEKKDNDMRSILQKEVELSIKQNFLTQEADRLQKERDSYKIFETDLRKLQQELVKMQKEVSQGTSNQCTETNIRNIHVQTDLDDSSMIDAYKTLEKEKLNLMNLLEKQKLKIEQITLHNAQLSRQLEETRSLRSIDIEVPMAMSRIISTNTVVSESSSTEDILHDAKMRLKRLEEESSKADQYFSSFVNISSQ